MFFPIAHLNSKCWAETHLYIDDHCMRIILRARSQWTEVLASSPGAPMRDMHARNGACYHVRDVRWNQLPYMTQQQVGRLEAQIFSPKFEVFYLNVTISYESASQGPSVPSLGVKSRDLHGKLDHANVYYSLAEPDPYARVWLRETTSISRFHLSVDTFELPCKLKFLTHSEEAEASPLADS